MAFVVVRVNFEYNDEVYNEAGSDPVRVFLNKEAAEKAANERTAKELKSITSYRYRNAISDYGGYDFRPISTRAKLTEMGFDMECEADYDFSLPKDMTDAQYLEIVEPVRQDGIQFFKVVEVELEE